LKLDACHLRQPKALPFPSGRQAFAGTAGKLKGERAFLAIGMAQYCGANCARVALIETEHLLALDHAPRDQIIGARQGNLRGWSILAGYKLPAL
jgi:hypothetical protein